MKHVITVAFLIGALAAYAASAGTGLSIAFLLAGMVCEGVFWWRLVRERRRPREGYGNDTP